MKKRPQHHDHIIFIGFFTQIPAIAKLTFQLLRFFWNGGYSIAMLTSDFKDVSLLAFAKTVVFFQISMIIED